MERSGKRYTTSASPPLTEWMVPTTMRGSLSSASLPPRAYTCMGYIMPCTAEESSDLRNQSTRSSSSPHTKLWDSSPSGSKKSGTENGPGRFSATSIAPGKSPVSRFLTTLSHASAAFFSHGGPERNPESLLRLGVPFPAWSGLKLYRSAA